MKILIVEDEKKTGEYLTKGLTEAGFVVDAALPAQEAVQQVLDWLDAHGAPTGR